MIAASYIFVLILVIINVFTKHQKGNWEKKVMLFFAVLTSAAAGLFAGKHTLDGHISSLWMLVFPVWNIANGLLLLLMLRCSAIDVDCIRDEDATMPQVVCASVVLSFVFVICNTLLDLHWSYTLSICMVYVSSFQAALTDVFGARHLKE